MNRTLRLLGSLFLMLICNSNLCASILIGPTLNPANGHSYILLNPSTWTAAETEALSLGGHLVTINDAAENSWVFSTFGGTRPLWIGLSDASSEGTFTWASGEPLLYTNWSAGEPNDGLGNFAEDYAYMVENSPGLLLTPSRWNDAPNNGQGVLRPVHGVVELVPEPTSTLLMGLGVLFGIRACGRRRASR